METTKRPTAVTIAAIALLVLALFVAGLGIANQFGLLGRRGVGNRVFYNGQTRNRNFVPPNGLPSGGFSNNQGTTPDFIPNRTGISGITRLFSFLGPVTIGLDITMLILAIVAAIGLFRSKRWAAILAIVLAMLLILLAIPGMLRIFSTVVFVENLVRMLLGVAVIVLLLLPASRKSFTPPQELDMDI
jgi:lysylphosphatidylglycerol synthetase-like protein (DUF2156 family)